jgi:Zn ribbon nucleic-acid-binding protein
MLGCPNCHAGPDAVVPSPHSRNLHRVECVTCGFLWSLPSVEMLEQVLSDPEIAKDLVDRFPFLDDDPDVELVPA